MTAYRLTPTRYYPVIGTAEPALTIASGDTVLVACVDARGEDLRGEQVTTPGNPMSGPIAVEGAEEGDSLSVQILRITPSRSTGWSRARLASNVVEPDFVRDLPFAPDERHPHDGEWDVDIEAGTATLVAPQTKLGRYVLPLTPMIGCLGVAPAREQAISTASSAEHGGNMDYRRFYAGTVAYFPVSVPGALFFVGDAHATQGDGEISGTGIEISAEIELRFELRKGRTIGWPRGETETHIFAVGNARPLDQALQHATTEMARWLVSDCGLDAQGAQILMGQTVEYEIANVYNPAYSVVCRMDKRWLRALV